MWIGKCVGKRPLLLLALLLRCAFIAHPSAIVFDEVHYAGFVAKYFMGEHVVDIHPPLGRMLFYAVALLIKKGRGICPEVDASAKFKIGNSYLEGILSDSYVAMRLLSGVSSAALIVVTHEILATAGLTEAEAFMGALFVLLDGSFQCLHRLIMVDSMALLMSGVSLLSLVKLASLSKPRYKRGSIVKLAKTQSATDEVSSRPIDHTPAPLPKPARAQGNRIHRRKRGRLAWTCVLGVAMGVGMSIKWTCLFMAFPLLVHFSIELFRNALSLSRACAKILGCVGSLALVLALASGIYLLSVYCNFVVQDRYGPGAHMMSFEYQSTLKGNPYEGMRELVVRDGLPVRLGFRKSRQFFFFDGGELVLRHDLGRGSVWKMEAFGPGAPIEFGSRVRLRHLDTHLCLGISGDALAVLQDGPSTTDESIAWTLERADDAGFARMRNQHAYLSADPSGISTSRGQSTEMVVLSDSDQGVPSGRASRGQVKTVKFRRLGFVGKFLELSKTMVRLNNSIKGAHPYSSQPRTWMFPLSHVLLWSSGSSEALPWEPKHDSNYVILLGSHLNWALGFISVLALLLGFQKLSLRPRIIWVVLASYLGNYLPYFFMGREKYLHHYLPSLFFSLLCLGMLVSRLPRFAQLSALTGAAAVFALQWPLAMGLQCAHEACSLLGLRGLISLPCEGMGSFLRH